MPDSRRVVAGLPTGGAARLVDVTTGGRPRRRPYGGDYLAWFANGGYVTDGAQGKIVGRTDIAGVGPHLAVRQTVRL